MTELSYEKVIKHFGSPASLARALGIKPQAIYQWREAIPPLRRYEIQALLADHCADHCESDDQEVA